MATNKAKILIVEDDLDLSEMLKAYFNVQGYEVIVSAWGEPAVELAGEMIPDLAILDIHLPDIDGYEVFNRLRASHKTRNIPVIFLTERRDRDDRLLGLELGVVDYITKPFDIQELRLRVRNTLHRVTVTTAENPVTTLPEGEPVDEELRLLIEGERDQDDIIIAELRGLDSFRDHYGYMAA
ncbi:MAG: response regulator transcription factor, partial [Chloroflexi bacterium]|nr:response regulator transcription factor [Chloroflexota bacterium]